MGRALSQFIRGLDLTVHPENKKQGGMSLLRSRMLSFCCLTALLGSSTYLAIILLNRSLDRMFFPISIIFSQSLVILILNRFIRRNRGLSAALLILIGLMIGVGIVHQIRSVYASVFLWFQVLIMPAFLLCGRRLGTLVSLLIALIALGTVVFASRHGSALPYEGLRILSLRSMLTTVLIINALTLGSVGIYFHLLRESEKSSSDQKTWLQRTGRMQELLQMSGHFALKTNGPLDVVGTALHNLEEPLKHERDSRTLLAMLAPVESGIQDLANVARSFSLFSKRYQDEGLEQTSYNTVLQHVDTISNVGSVRSGARLHWEMAKPDIVISTQTAKLVMLISSILRRIKAQGATRLIATPSWDAAGLHITFAYGLANGVKGEASATDEHFDPELNEDLIEELCRELDAVCRSGRESGRSSYRLTLQQESCQAHLA